MWKRLKACVLFGNGSLEFVRLGSCHDQQINSFLFNEITQCTRVALDDFHSERYIRSSEFVPSQFPQVISLHLQFLGVLLVEIFIQTTGEDDSVPRQNDVLCNVLRQG